jgi:HK97 family phage major capsid protein
MNIKDLMKKAYSELSDEEKVFLKANIESMSADEKVKFEEDVKEDEKEVVEAVAEEEIDAEAVKSLISDSVKTSVEKKVDEITDGIVAKFMKGVKTQRSSMANKEIKKPMSKGEMGTRNFMKALVDGRTQALREQELNSKSLDTTETGGKAGYLVPDELKAEILRIAEKQYGLARREMLYLPFSGPGNSRTVPTLASTISVTWTGEKVAKSSSQPVFGIVTQTLKKLAVIIPMSEEILEDSLINLTTLLGELVAEAISKEEDLQFFVGTGSPWTGILKNTSVNIVTMGTGDTSFLNVDADDLLDMQDATPTGAFAGAKYYMHRSIFNVLRKLKDDDGNPIFQRATESTPGLLWEKPYELSDAFPAKGDTAEDTAFILFGNLKQGAIFGDKQQIRVKMLDQATITDTDGETTVNLAEQDMVALRFVERVGYVVSLPSALTVLKTATTVSA